jgi:hypothetical protein
MRSSYGQTLAKRRQQLALIEARAKTVSAQLETQLREAEKLKVVLMKAFIEEQIKTKALHRGMSALLRERKRIRGSMLSAASGLIIGGLITGDNLIALNTGLSSFTESLQKSGYARWFVSLGKRIAVAAVDEIQSSGGWVTWESLKLALEELKERAHGGEELGGLDSIISKLKQGKTKLVHLYLLPVKPGSSGQGSYQFRKVESLD